MALKKYKRYVRRQIAFVSSEQPFIFFETCVFKQLFLGERKTRLVSESHFDETFMKFHRKLLKVHDVPLNLDWHWTLFTNKLQKINKFIKAMLLLKHIKSNDQVRIHSILDPHLLHVNFLSAGASKNRNWQSIHKLCIDATILHPSVCINKRRLSNVLLLLQLLLSRRKLLF